MKNEELYRENLRSARRNWPEQLAAGIVSRLKGITEELSLSVRLGEVMLLDRNWYVTHAGLLRIAKMEGCSAIHVSPVFRFCDPSLSRWAFRATIYKNSSCKGFAGYGDADPTNVSALVRGAEMRIAETRAVNRALRKAYGIGLCSIEEIGSRSGPLGPPARQQKQPGRAAVLGANGNGHHLRDRLLVLIRQQKLDGALVKAYAADFCGVKELRDATKEQVQEFITHLSEYVTNDRDGLLCQLNSYVPKQESAA